MVADFLGTLCQVLYEILLQCVKRASELHGCERTTLLQPFTITCQHACTWLLNTTPAGCSADHCMVCTAHNINQVSTADAGRYTGMRKDSAIHVATGTMLRDLCSTRVGLCDNYKKASAWGECAIEPNHLIVTTKLVRATISHMSVETNPWHLRKAQLIQRGPEVAAWRRTSARNECVKTKSS